MNKIKDALSDFLGFVPSHQKLILLEKWRELFVEYNSHTNLMSKNDIPLLYNKHVIDSLALCKLNEFKKAESILDVGTGGGFPSVILSIFFDDLTVYALDSVGKKIDFVKLVKNELSLNNLIPINSRAEDLSPLSADILTSRAVGKIAHVWRVSSHHLKKGGIFISYKSAGAKSEAEIASAKYPELKNPDFISYKLPLEENYTRELVVFKVL